MVWPRLLGRDLTLADRLRRMRAPRGGLMWRSAGLKACGGRHGLARRVVRESWRADALGARRLGRTRSSVHGGAARRVAIERILRLDQPPATLSPIELPGREGQDGCGFTGNLGGLVGSLRRRWHGQDTRAIAGAAAVCFHGVVTPLSDRHAAGRR